ncbi:gluconokinase [Azospirillum sp. RWY-5-1]|uniref:Gluconokinase n=1 Tax=Azospirillum oleiclasticum TaxID=2735135 RepID=A0ABX2TM79_9PROT|nr:gluconokinase [Azospirillum oleiclasticum]NYZ16825.1 gluconokinase [Azospirillum oleiclasticum]NYZ24442.1 gluconokinase [Azospirillum oleiclasticum]
MIVLVMGVSGSGKSTVGLRLAERLDATFLEADEFHPPANIAKMAGGVALTDEDRWPWLDALADGIRQAREGGRTVVVACSALKQVYRDRLLAGQDGDAHIVHLAGEPTLIAERMAARSDHFMPPSLLATQIATLESPADAVTIDITAPPDRLVETILHSLAPVR